MVECGLISNVIFTFDIILGERIMIKTKKTNGWIDFLKYFVAIGIGNVMCDYFGLKGAI